MNGPVTFEVGYESDGVYSINLIWANTGNCELEAVTETAERHAKRYGYQVAYVKQLTACEAAERLHKGMPMYHIDDEAERKYDLSFAGRSE